MKNHLIQAEFPGTCQSVGIFQRHRGRVPFQAISLLFHEKLFIMRILKQDKKSNLFTKIRIMGALPKNAFPSTSLEKFSGMWKALKTPLPIVISYLKGLSLRKSSISENCMKGIISNRSLGRFGFSRVADKRSHCKEYYSKV